MLEGKEVEGKIGTVGNYSVDVDTKLNVKFELILKEELEGIKFGSNNSVELPLLVLIEKACAKNNVVWDEALLAQFKLMLGLIG